MAEYHHKHQEEAVESGDRGLFDFTNKKNKEEEEEEVLSEFEEKLMLSDQNSHHEKNHHISEDEEEKKRRKEEMDTEVPIEKIHVEDKLPPPPPPGGAVEEEKKGFLEKIKNKIPGFNSKSTTTCEEEK